jgi:hypothetical protein
MMVDWDEVQKVIFPIKNYEDACQRLRLSLSYTFVHKAYNFSLSELENYTQLLLKGDARGRYVIYASRLSDVIHRLHAEGVMDVLDLRRRTASREHLENLTGQVEVSAPEISMLLKYLVYWVVPAEKYLSGLVRDEPGIREANEALREVGIRTNLQLLEAGITPVNRKELSEKTNQPIETITELVNRADFSRMPWASKATISNIIGAGYGSLAKLAKAIPDKLYADFFAYGKSIGKNLKLGNEIESSYRVAKIIPRVLLEA